MYRFLILVLLLASAPISALAAQQARLEMDIVFGEEFNAEGEAAKEPSVIPALHGMMYWNDQQLRFDVIGNPGLPPVSIIYDYRAQTIYEVDHSRRKAFMRSMSEFNDMLGPLATGFDSPERILFSWQQVEQLRTLDGVGYRDLGRETIDGYPSRGVFMSFDMRKLAANPELASETLGLAELAKLIPKFETKTWVADKLELPLLMEVDMGLMRITMRLKDIKDLEAGPVFFMVPTNYKVEDAPTLRTPAASSTN
jgi:hypothetical protein